MILHKLNPNMGSCFHTYHSFEIADGLFEQLLAHDGRPVVAVMAVFRYVEHTETCALM
jgi:hypothetical protein